MNIRYVIKFFKYMLLSYIRRLFYLIVVIFRNRIFRDKFRCYSMWGLFFFFILKFFIVGYRWVIKYEIL